MNEDDYNLDFTNNTIRGKKINDLERRLEDLACRVVLERTEEPIDRALYYENEFPDDGCWEVLDMQDAIYTTPMGSEVLYTLYDDKDNEKIEVPEMDYEEMPKIVFDNLSAITPTSGLILSGNGDHTIESIAPLPQGERFKRFAISRGDDKKYFEYTANQVMKVTDWRITNGVFHRGSEYFLDDDANYMPVHDFFELIGMPELAGILFRINGRTYKLLRENNYLLNFISGSMCTSDGTVIFDHTKIKHYGACVEGRTYKVSMGGVVLHEDLRDPMTTDEVGRVSHSPRIKDFYQMFSKYRGCVFVMNNVYPGNIERQVPRSERSAWLFNKYGFVVNKGSIWNKKADKAQGTFAQFVNDLGTHTYLNQIIKKMRKSGCTIDYSAIRRWLRDASVIMNKGKIVHYRKDVCMSVDMRKPTPLAPLALLENDDCDIEKVKEEIREVWHENDEDRRLLEVGDLCHALLKYVGGQRSINTLHHIMGMKEMEPHIDKFRLRIKEMSTLNKVKKRDALYYDTLETCSLWGDGLMLEPSFIAINWLQAHNLYGKHFSLWQMTKWSNATYGNGKVNVGEFCMVFGFDKLNTTELAKYMNMLHVANDFRSMVVLEILVDRYRKEFSKSLELLKIYEVWDASLAGGEFGRFVQLPDVRNDAVFDEVDEES